MLPPCTAASLRMLELKKTHLRPVIKKTVSISGHHGQLELVFKVGDRPHPPENGPGLFFSGVVHQQAGKGVNGDLGVVRQGNPDHLHALLDGEEALFGGVPGHGHDDAVENLQGPLQ